MTGTVTTIIDAADELSRRVSDGGDPPPAYRSLRDGYARLGLAPGAALLVLATNSVEFLLHWIAIVANGYVPCAVAPSTKAATIDALRQSLTLTAVVGPGLRASRHRADRWSSIGSYEVAIHTGVPTPYRPFEALILTTGTSGLQTACVHAVDSLAWNASMTNQTLGLGTVDRQLVVLPMYHSYGLVLQSIAAIVGGHELVIDGPPFNADRLADAIGSHRISMCGLTPTIVRDLLRRGTVLPGLRKLSIGGDQIRPDEIGALLAKPFINELYVSYGLTEAGPRISVLPAHDAPVDTHDSVGRPLAGIETRIQTPDADGVGQLLVRTPSVCRRKTGRGVVSQPFTTDGYLETGDLFTQDDRGYLRYKARRADVVIVKGEKLNTTSVDRVAAAHPDVEFARTTQTAENSLVTRLWARNDKILNLDEIKSFMRASLRLHEVPDMLFQQSGDTFHK